MAILTSKKQNETNTLDPSPEDILKRSISVIQHQCERSKQSARFSDGLWVSTYFEKYFHRVGWDDHSEHKTKHKFIIYYPAR